MTTMMKIQSKKNQLKHSNISQKEFLTMIILAFHTSNLSFFLHGQNFWKIRFTPKKRVNYDKIHSKLPIFCVESVKIYTGKKKFTRACLWRS